MTTIKISVKNKRDANLLYRMLKKISFIDTVEKADVLIHEEKPGQFEKMNAILDAMSGNELFKEITNPVTWQKKLRNEWE